MDFSLTRTFLQILVLLALFRAGSLNADVVQTPTPEAIAAITSSAVIGDIQIRRLNIFDVNSAQEDGKLHRLVNAVHVRSREDLIRNQLLFVSGEPYSQQLLEETERLLRSNDYIYDAKIQVSTVRDDVVDILVTTQDVWTLTASGSASHAGGETRAKLSLEERNLFGTGIGLRLAQRSNIDRNTLQFELVDNHIGGTHFRGLLGLATSSDGGTLKLDLESPFYALDTRRAGGVSFIDDERTDQIYYRGEIVDEYRHRERATELAYGWSAGLIDNWVSRYTTGVAFEQHQFSAMNGTTGYSELPENREYAYPFIDVEVIENRFTEATNVHQIHRTEDMFLGTRIAARLGYAGNFLGNAASAWLARATVDAGFGDLDKTAFFVGGGIKGRLQDGTIQNLLIDTRASVFWRQSPSLMFTARLQAESGTRLDRDGLLLLGGDNGLRGYPLRYQTGDHRALLTVEQRLFTTWQPFHLFSFGAVAFVDVGRAWGESTGQFSNTDLLSDIGVGLRFGSRRSSSGRMLHVDLAFPLNAEPGIDSLQLLIGTKKKF